MAKRPQWLPPFEQSTADDRAFIEMVDSLFVNAREPALSVIHRENWLGKLTEDERAWIEALEVADRSRDTSRIIAMLKADTPISRNSRFYLADFIDRYALRPKRGGQRVPAYDRSTVEAMISLALESVSESIDGGKTSAEALEIASTTFSIPLKHLAAAYEGKRNSTRRAKSNRP